MRIPREHIILEHRRQEELRDQATAMVEYNKQFDLKVRGHFQQYIHTKSALQTKWEQTTDKTIQRNAVKRQVDGLLQQKTYSLKERRDRY